jgi:hypothetical protein
MRLAVLLLLAPTVAAARPITAGVNAGVIAVRSDPDQEANNTLGLFGRVGFSKRISGQLDVMRIETNDDVFTPTTVRSFSASLVVDLMDKGPLIPTLTVTAGLDRATSDGDTLDGHHYEGGLGLEYRSESGLNIGADVRLGGRSVDQPDYVLDSGVIAFVPDNAMQEGEYRAFRLTVGVVFR